jgi:predicted nucleotidyltransferase
MATKVAATCMLRDRILSTLRFFDLQDLPVTLLELHEFLLPEMAALRSNINGQGELISAGGDYKAGIDQVLRCLDNECNPEVEEKNGYYCLRGRMGIIDVRLANYLYGIKREKLIRKYIRGLRHVPFVRGAALAGSQAMGQEKENSDIDLLIIVDPKFLWLARTAVTAYFQLMGRRRHGKYISNRFCLNHYLAGVKQIGELKNLYTAWEYAKLRPLIYGEIIVDFQNKNREWIAAFFPNFEAAGIGNHRQLQPPPPAGAGYSSLMKEERLRSVADEPRSSLQQILERLLSGGFGEWLEQKLKNWQLHRIRQEEFILVREDELSFHPQSKQKELLQSFFGE